MNQLGDKSKKILLTGGGTAGHVIPNFALLPYLIKGRWSIYYVGSYKGIEQSLVQKKGIPYYSIHTGKLRRYFSLQNFLDIFRVIIGTLQSCVLLLKLKPKVIFSKGGFVGVPVAIASFALRVPLVIHESDKTLGLANKISALFCR